MSLPLPPNVSTPLLPTATPLECPQCGKHTVVSYQRGLYQCLHCSFERNLNATEFTRQEQGGLGGPVMAGIGVLLTCALLL